MSNNPTVESFTKEDVSNFIKAIVELEGIRKVDNTPDKYIRFASDDSQIMESVDGRSIPLAIFGTVASDCLIVNPFAEGSSQGAVENWLMSSSSKMLAMNLTAIMCKLLEVGIASKSKSKEDKSDNRKAIKIIGKLAADIDEKMQKEFKSISSDPLNFFSIFYNNTTKTTDIKCTLYIEARQKGYPSVRKVTWKTLKALMSKVLGTEDLGTLSYKSTLFGCPVFEGFVNVLVNVYDAISHALPLIESEVNTTTVRGHLKYMEQYYYKARWCMSTVPVPQEQPGMAAPWMPGNQFSGAVPAGGYIQPATPIAPMNPSPFTYAVPAGGGYMIPQQPAYANPNMVTTAPRSAFANQLSQAPAGSSVYKGNPFIGK